MNERRPAHDPDTLPPKSDPDGPAEICGANFGIRALAHGVDLGILILFACLISIPPFLRAFQQGDFTDSGAVGLPVGLTIAIDIGLAIGVIVLWHRTQTTPGKALFRLKIVNLDDGGPPRWSRLVIRFLVYIVALVPVPLRLFALADPSLEEHPVYGVLFSTWLMCLPLLLGFFWILIDSRNRGWHDLLSGTVTGQKPPAAFP